MSLEISFSLTGLQMTGVPNGWCQTDPHKVILISTRVAKEWHALIMHMHQKNGRTTLKISLWDFNTISKYNSKYNKY